MCIAFSGIFYRWAEVSPSTGTVFRCLFGLPLLALVAVAEQRRFGPLPLATVGFSPNFVPAVIAGSGLSTIFGDGAADVSGSEGEAVSLALPESDLSSPHAARAASPAGTAMSSERRRTVGAS